MNKTRRNKKNKTQGGKRKTHKKSMKNKKNIIIQFPRQEEYERVIASHRQEEKTAGHDLSWRQFLLRLISKGEK